VQSRGRESVEVAGVAGVYKICEEVFIMKTIIRSAVLVLALCCVTAASALASPATEASAGEEPVLLELFLLYSNTSGFMESWWADVLEEQVGVQIELIPAGDQGEQKLQALMAGGELPDIVGFKNNRQIEDAIRANMLVNLDKHLDALPNVTTVGKDALQYYRDKVSAGTGGVYAIPDRIGPGDVGADLNWGPYLRWDLYKQIGMPKIRTLEDYLPVIKAMQELEPENKDGQAVYGITLWKDWDGYVSFLATEPGAVQGVDTGDQLGSKLPFLQVDLKTSDTKSIIDNDSQYIRALRFYFKANQMGLIDPDSPTQRFDAAWNKVENGRILFSWWPWFAGKYDTAENTEADPPRGFRPIFADECRPFWPANKPIGGGWPIAISSETDHLDAALRYVDFMFSADGLMTLANGPRGVTWDVGANGKPYVTDEGWNLIESNETLPGGGTLTAGTATLNFYGLSLMTENPSFGVPISYTYWPSSQGRNPSALLKDWQETTGYSTMRDLVWEQQGYTPMPLAISMIPTIPEDLQSLASQIGDVVKTSSWLMMFAEDEAEFNELYDDMVVKAKGLGLEKVLDWGLGAWAEAKEIAANYR
jgi:putative aldouronate transport system substrate-binding protein